MARNRKQLGFPSHIRIAGTNHEVELDASHPGSSTQAMGAIHHNEARIYVDSSFAEWRQRKTLLHELVHAADRNFGANDLEESQVEALENGLWAIFNDNPGLARAIFGDNA